MSDNRWTIREVGADIREIVRQAHTATKMPASQIVRQALREWAQNHPEALAEAEPSDDLEFCALLSDVGELLVVQKALVQQLIDQLANPVGSH